MIRMLLLLGFGLIISIACKRSATIAVNDNTDSMDVNTDTVVMKLPALTKVWESDTSLLTPESVLYDAANNVLYVSNIGGVPPNKKDGDGFITKMDTNGKIITLKWVTGFDAPKGMALTGTTLYVTDIDRLKAVDIKTGKVTNTWKIPGSTFLNDVVATQDSVIYFTDSDKSAIHKLQKGKLSVVLEDTSLGGTNGIYFHEDKLFLAGYESGNVSTYNLDDQSINQVAAQIPGGDGIERYRDGWIVSNWNGEIHYIDNTGKVTELIDTQAAKLNSADIEVIEERNLLIVPTFFGNKVIAYEIKG